VNQTSIVAYSCSPRCCTGSATMTPNPTDESSSILQDGKLKSGIYKIWNISTETYADIEVQSRNVCCRPAQNLGEGNGLVRSFHQFVVHASNDYKWEIKPLGTGYSVRRVSASMWTDTISAILSSDRREVQVEPGKPDQFCTLMGVVSNSTISAAPYPVAWRVEIVDDIKHRGFEYVR